MQEEDVNAKILSLEEIVHQTDINHSQGSRCQEVLGRRTSEQERDPEERFTKQSIVLNSGTCA